MSGMPAGITSPALRRASDCIMLIDVALRRRWLSRCSNETLAECRETIVELSRENRRLRTAILIGERVQ